MMSSSDLAEIEQIIMQANLKSRRGHQVVDNSSQVYPVGEDCSQPKQQLPSLDLVSKTLGENIINTIHDLGRILHSKDQAKGQFERQIKLSNQNISDKIKAISSQLQENRDRVMRLRQNMHRESELLEGILQEQAISVEDSKYYIDRTMALQRRLETNKSGFKMDPPSPIKRSLSKNKKVAAISLCDQIVFPGSPKLKKTGKNRLKK